MALGRREGARNGISTRVQWRMVILFVNIVIIILNRQNLSREFISIFQDTVSQNPSLLLENGYPLARFLSEDQGAIKKRTQAAFSRPPGWRKQSPFSVRERLG
jgi:hypothetical protein